MLRYYEQYVTGRTYKVYIFFIRITSRVELTMIVCLSVRMSALFLKIIIAHKLLRFSFSVN